MDRNRFTWNSQIGFLSKKQFLLLSLTACFGAFLVSDKDISRTFQEIFLGFAVVSIAFQLLMWRNDINNYLLFLKQSLNKNIKNTMNIYGEEVDLRNHKDEKMERYLEVHGKTDTKIKKILAAGVIFLLAFLIQYFILKSMSIPFYSIVGLAMTMALTNAFGELLIPILLQFIMVIFRIPEFNKKILIYLFIYILLLFFCVSSQYLLETSFYRNSKKKLVSFSRSRILKMIRSVGLLFLFIILANHFLPGNTDWYKKLFNSTSQTKYKGDSNPKLTSKNDFKEKTDNKDLPEGLSHDQYKFNQSQKEKLHDIEDNLEQFTKELKQSKNLIKHIGTMKGFENLDLSSYVQEYEKKQSNLKLNIDSLTKEINQLKEQKNLSMKDLNQLMDQLKDIKEESNNLKEYSKNFNTSNSSNEELKLSNGGTYQELDEMLKNMNTSLDETGDSVEKMKKLLEKNASTIANNLNESSTPNNSKDGSLEDVKGAGTESIKKETKKEVASKKEKINWDIIINMLMIILAFIVLEKIFKIFRNKKLQTKSDKKLKKKWAEELNLLNKKKLEPDEEIIQTYKLLHSFLERKHYEEIGENAPPALILFLNKMDYYNNIEKQFFYITDLFMRCRYGQENVLEKELKLFRKCVKYSWKRI